MVLVLPSLPVPEIRMANGAGLSWADSQTRSLASNQRISGTGSLQGSAILISESGTLAGNGAMASGGVPNTVARNPAESDRPVAGPGVDWGGASGGSAETAKGTLHSNTSAICRNRLIIRIVVTIVATA